MDQQLSSVRDQWIAALQHLYPASETRFIFRIALEDLLHLSPNTFRTSELVFNETQIAILHQALKRLETGEPIQHIAGFTYFDELKIRVSPAVLIPRPETEELVHWISENAGKDPVILDICTGSGCIALALKKELPDSHITGIDLSPEAIAIARSNASLNGLAVEFATGNALQLDFFTGRKPSVIVSNPPYIPLKEKDTMHLNVTGFEPDLALFVPDEDPLLFYRAITGYAAEHLCAGGQLYFELHEQYAEQTKALVQSFPQFCTVEIRPDLQGKSRMLRASIC